MKSTLSGTNKAIVVAAVSGEPLREVVTTAVRHLLTKPPEGQLAFLGARQDLISSLVMETGPLGSVKQ